MLSVDDTGVGMTPDQVERVFEPFYQADMSATRAHEGTGLGLTTAQRLAERLGGSIRVRSSPGEGSRFVLSLPVAATG